MESVFASFFQFSRDMIEQQFVRSSVRRFYGVVDNVEDILPRIEAAL